MMRVHSSQHRYAHNQTDNVQHVAADVHKKFMAMSNRHLRIAGLGFAQMRFDKAGNLLPMRTDPTEAARIRSQAAEAAAANAPSPQTTATPGAPTTPVIAGSSTTASSVTVNWAAVKDAAAYGIYVDGKLVGHATKPTFTGNVGKKTSYVQFDSVDSSGRRSAATQLIRVEPTATGIQVAIAQTQPTAPATAASGAAAAPTR